MPTHKEVTETWLEYGTPDVPEYKIEYYRTPTKKEPTHHYTFEWTRIYSLPEVRKKAMNMIKRGVVSPNEETYMRSIRNMSYWVLISKDSPRGEKDVGIVVKVGDTFFWKGSRAGDFHVIKSDGSIGSKSIRLPLPKPKISKRKN